MIKNNFDTDMDGFIDFCKEVVESHPGMEREVHDLFEIAMQKIENGATPHIEISRIKTTIRRILQWKSRES